jgi:predicted dehydrogenase
LIKLAIVGLGKMGLSHLALCNAHPDVEVTAVCDSSGFVLGVLNREASLATFNNYERMLEEADLDAVVIATPSRVHAPMVQAALEKGLHVFCEKPFTLDPEDAERLTSLGTSLGLVTQVGYHNRFVASFQTMKSLLDAGAIGEVTHALAEANGPVVLKPKGSTWRSKGDEGGGCLHDYAAHALDLLDWYLGEPTRVGGTALNSVFSRETNDQVYSTLFYEGGKTAQLSADWSDASLRKMTTRITLWGTAGRLYADRQEMHLYVGHDDPPDGYDQGWNIRYTTEMTQPVWFYLRGEEYSAQLNAFFERVQAGKTSGLNSFESAANTDKVIAAISADAKASPVAVSPGASKVNGPSSYAIERFAHSAAVQAGVLRVRGRRGLAALKASRERRKSANVKSDERG